MDMALKPNVLKDLTAEVRQIYESSTRRAPVLIVFVYSRAISPFPLNLRNTGQGQTAFLWRMNRDGSS